MDLNGVSRNAKHLTTPRKILGRVPSKLSNWSIPIWNPKALQPFFIRLALDYSRGIVQDLTLL
jgi:hypothetical protein